MSLRKVFIILPILIIIFIFNLLTKFAGGQEEVTRAPTQPTTANVTILGAVGIINVTCFPVNFTEGPGLIPNPIYRPKISPSGGVCGNGRYVRFWVEETNVDWNLFIMATDLMGQVGNYRIPAENLYVNSTCNGTLTPPVPLIQLSSANLVSVCTDLSWDAIVDVEFYITPPEGQYNTTYYGNLTIFVNSSYADNNATLDLPDNTTVTITKYVEIGWNIYTTPIYFGLVPAGGRANATNSTPTNTAGWPANISNSRKTNIFIDYYINGTDFVNVTPATPWRAEFCSGSTCKFESENVTYSNATSEQTWPDSLRALKETYYSTPFWEMVRNNSETPSWWNISIPAGLPRATYVANIIAIGVDHGTAP